MAWTLAAGAGAYVDIRLPDGRRVGTGSDWLVSTTATGNWTAKQFDDGGWAAATVDDVSWASLDPSSPTRWIWSTDSYNHNEVFLRFVIPEFSAEALTPSQRARRHACP